jgi:non-lysosomal glucosylceramidase
VSQPPPHEQLIPSDKALTPEARAALRARGAPTTYRGADRQHLGMPCGGLGAGQLYLLGDGRLGGWHIDGALRFTGFGASAYHQPPPARHCEQGFAIATRTPAGVTRTARLSDEDFNAITFTSEYPRALVNYAEPRDPLPVAIQLEAFSPFVPLDAHRSAWPATIFHFHLTNQTDAPVDIALGGWLANPTYAERISPQTIQHHAAVHQTADNTGVLFSAAAGPGQPLDPPTPGLPLQTPISDFRTDRLLERYTDPEYPPRQHASDTVPLNAPYLLFQPQPSPTAQTTRVELVVDTMTVRTIILTNDNTPPAVAWRADEFAHQRGRVVVTTTPPDADPHVDFQSFTLTNRLPAAIQEFSPHAPGYGTVALTALRPDAHATADCGNPQAWLAELLNPQTPANTATETTAAVHQAATLAPGERRTLTFFLTWHFPNLHTGRGRMYANRFTDAADVATQLATECSALTVLTRRFCDTFYRDATLPWWLLERLMMTVSNLASGTCQWWRNGRFWGWEGVGCCPGTCTHVWNYAHAHARLFPELARSTRRLQDLAAGLDPATGLVGFRSSRDYAADGQAGTLLKCYREHRCSPDNHFLTTHWPQIRLVLDYLLAQDPDEDGLVTNSQPNTYDINFESPNTFVGALYLAALHASEAMAHRVGDARTAERCRVIYERGRANTVNQLYNGEYFIQAPTASGLDWQYGAGCLSDQLFGQNWAHQLDLGYLYPPDQVRSALGAVYRYNFAPRVSTYNQHYPPERTFADGDDAGLLLCTWPNGRRPREPVRYRDEVWTGIEYQVASGLIAEDRVDEGLQLVRAIHDRYDGTHRNPFNEVECGDHYARAFASWGVLLNLSGFVYDGPAGILGFAPRIHEDDFACFFSAAAGWGTLRQRVTAGEPAGNAQLNTITLAHGHLDLRQLRVQIPAPLEKLKLTLTRSHQPLSFTTHRQEDWTTLTLDPPIHLAADQPLTLTAHW